jgi:hypothetical protein
MAFEFENRHQRMDRNLDAVLEAYKNGLISLSQARSSLVHLLKAPLKAPINERALLTF